MTIRGSLLIIWVFFWLFALGCWVRARRSGSQRLTREGWLFLWLGVPFLVAAVFYTSSSYPGEVHIAAPAITATPVPAAPSPTPAPAAPAPLVTPVDPRAHEKAVHAAQREAVARYPDLGVAGTPLNAAFVNAYRRRKAEDPEFLNDPQWPVQLADDLARRFPSAR